MFFRHLLVLVLLVLAAVSTVSAQTCRSEVNVPSSTPTNRFTDNGDGTVTDTATGLMWARCPEGQSGTDCANGVATGFTWEQALTQARDATLAGYGDWRLPDIKELSSLGEERCYDPAINLAVFPNTDSFFFWSASPSNNSAGSTWYVNFYNGNVYLNGRGGNEFRVRLVRSGQ